MERAHSASASSLFTSIYTTRMPQERASDIKEILR